MYYFILREKVTFINQSINQSKEYLSTAPNVVMKSEAQMSDWTSGLKLVAGYTLTVMLS